MMEEDVFLCQTGPTHSPQCHSFLATSLADSHIGLLQPTLTLQGEGAGDLPWLDLGPSALPHLILIKTSSFYHPHLMDEETEARTGSITCPRSYH